MSVIKRNKQNSVSDLCKFLGKLIELLREQKELDAVVDLEKALAILAKHDEKSSQFKQALAIIQDAFEGEHDLGAYALLRKDRQGQWGEVEELYLASSTVMNLVRRLTTA